MNKPYDVNKAIKEYKAYKAEKQAELNSILKHNDKQALQEFIAESNRLDEQAKKKDLHIHKMT